MSIIRNHINFEPTSSINSNDEEKKIWAILEQVADPEIPVLSIVDLGIVRKVKITSSTPPSGGLVVFITPTYSGCPAMDMIAMQIRIALLQNGYHDIIITTVLSPA